MSTDDRHAEAAFKADYPKDDFARFGPTDHVHERYRRIAAAVLAVTPVDAEMVRHKKTGGVYEVLHREGKVQSRRPLHDMDVLVSYRGVDDGQVWHRPPDEMNDGRFEPA